MQTERRVSILPSLGQSITVRLTVMFLLLNLALLLLVGSVLIFVANRSQRAQVRVIQEEIATKAALTLELYLEDVQRELISLVRQPNLMTMGEAERQASLQEFLEYRIDYVTYQGTFEEVALLTPTGRELAKLSNTRKFTAADFTNRSHEEAFRKAKEGGDYFGPVHRLPGGAALVVTLATPILGAGTQPEGVAVVEASITRMWGAVLPIEVGKTGYKYLVGGDDTIIAADTERVIRGEVVPDHVRLFRPALGADMEAREYRGIIGEQVVASAAPVGRTGWMVLAALPTSEAYSGVRQMILLLIGLLLLSAVLAGLMTVYLARRLVRPILALREGARLIGQGHLDHVITVTTQDELAELAGEFNRMAAQLEDSYADLEQKVEQRTTELTVANQELEAFSYSVSHDLRAPLRSIDGFSQVLLEDYEDELDAVGKSHLQRVRAASQRMGLLIDDLLDLSRVSRSEMRRETVDLSDLANTIAAELKRGQPERQVTFVIADGMVAKGDERLLQVALENLLVNAWKFTGKHATARIEFGIMHDQGESAYFVRDDGTGFDMAYVDKLFGAFQRLHGRNDFEGTGIGLATVQRVIHRHGGRVWAEAAVEQGATFYFTLA